MNQDYVRNRVYDAGICAAAAAGCTSFLEVGPGASALLTRMALNAPPRPLASPRGRILAIEANAESASKARRLLSGSAEFKNRYTILCGFVGEAPGAAAPPPPSLASPSRGPGRAPSPPASPAPAGGARKRRASSAASATGAPGDAALSSAQLRAAVADARPQAVLHEVLGFLAGSEGVARTMLEVQAMIMPPPGRPPAAAGAAAGAPALPVFLPGAAGSFFSPSFVTLADLVDARPHNCVVYVAAAAPSAATFILAADVPFAVVAGSAPRAALALCAEAGAAAAATAGAAAAAAAAAGPGLPTPASSVIPRGWHGGGAPLQTPSGSCVGCLEFFAFARPMGPQLRQSRETSFAAVAPCVINSCTCFVWAGFAGVPPPRRGAHPTGFPYGVPGLLAPHPAAAPAAAEAAAGANGAAEQPAVEGRLPARRRPSAAAASAGARAGAGAGAAAAAATAAAARRAEAEAEAQLALASFSSCDWDSATNARASNWRNVVVLLPQPVALAPGDVMRCRWEVDQSGPSSEYVVHVSFEPAACPAPAAAGRSSRSAAAAAAGSSAVAAPKRELRRPAPKRSVGRAGARAGGAGDEDEEEDEEEEAAKAAVEATAGTRRGAARGGVGAGKAAAGGGLALPPRIVRMPLAGAPRAPSPPDGGRRRAAAAPDAPALTIQPLRPPQQFQVALGDLYCSFVRDRTGDAVSGNEALRRLGVV